jgi:hypothetical protein
MVEENNNNERKEGRKGKMKGKWKDARETRLLNREKKKESTGICSVGQEGGGRKRGGDEKNREEEEERRERSLLLFFLLLIRSAMRKS